MWNQVKPSTPNTLMVVEYEDFATIEVVKKTNKTNSITHYTFNIDIVDVTEQSIDIYKLEDIENVMTRVKAAIEELYDEIPAMSNDDIEMWIDNFLELCNDY